MTKNSQIDLFEPKNDGYSLPDGYRLVKPDYFKVERIVLAKGSVSTHERTRFVESIIELYPKAEIIEQYNTPHNRIELGKENPIENHKAGKRTLVFGVHASSVRFSDEEGTTCPNYWHFSPYGFCPYGCKYCYLAGTIGVWHSPTVKIYVNIEQIIDEIDKTAKRLSKPTAFYLGKLQDGLALDLLTAYSTVFIPFFARNEYARQVILTKSDCVDRLLDLDHNENTILTWSLNPPEIASRFEANVPPVEARIEAMKKCSERGYPVRAVIMPLIPAGDWKKNYSNFIEYLIDAVLLDRLTLGGICIYKNAKRLMEQKIGRSNEISKRIDNETALKDGRARYSQLLRIEMYKHLITAAKKVRQDINIALCLEENGVWEALSIEENIGRCNCVL